MVQAKASRQGGCCPIIYHYISLVFRIFIYFKGLLSISFYRPCLIFYRPYLIFYRPCLPDVFLLPVVSDRVMMYLMPLDPSVFSYDSIYPLSFSGSRMFLSTVLDRLEMLLSFSPAYSAIVVR